MLDDEQKDTLAIPQTVIYAPSGTRRAAALAGINPDGDQYARWSQEQMAQSLQVIFDSGVQHLYMPMMSPTLFAETTSNYKTHLWRWLKWGIGGEEAIAMYHRLRCVPRLLLPATLAEMDGLALQEQLEADIPSGTYNQYFWIGITPDFYRAQLYVTNLLLQQTNDWSDGLETAASPTTAIEQIQLKLYGMTIPSPDLLLSFGKPTVSPSLLPPFWVTDKIACYWDQRPGYILTAERWHDILHDWSVERNTWVADKSGRAQEATIHQELWQNAAVLGTGRKIGGKFWIANTPPTK